MIIRKNNLLLSLILSLSIFFTGNLTASEYMPTLHKSFNPKDYADQEFSVSKKEYTHGSVIIKLIQVKRTSDHPKTPHYCRAWLEIVREKRTIKTMYFDDIEPLGYSYGLFVPNIQPSKEYFIVLKIGDYDGRLLLVDKLGNIINIEGGLYFLSEDKRYLFSNYASDLSILSIFDFDRSKVIYRSTNLPHIFQWYKKDNKYMFTISEWIDSTGNPSEKPGLVYVYDLEANDITKKEDSSELDGAIKQQYDFDPLNYRDCYCYK